MNKENEEVTDRDKVFPRKEYAPEPFTPKVTFDEDGMPILPEKDNKD